MCATTTQTLRFGVAEGAGRVTLARPAEYNTIPPALREELDAALDAAGCGGPWLLGDP